MIFWVGAITLAADKGKWEYEGDARGKTAGESASATHRKHQHRPLGKYVLLRQWRENLISESTFAVATVHCVHYARFTRSSSLLHETRSDPVRVSTDARHSSPLRCPVSFLLPTICRSKYLESSITRLCYRAFRGLSCARRNSFFFSMEIRLSSVRNTAQMVDFGSKSQKVWDIRDIDGAYVTYLI